MHWLIAWQINQLITGAPSVNGVSITKTASILFPLNKNLKCVYMFFFSFFFSGCYQDDQRLSFGETSISILTFSLEDCQHSNSEVNHKQCRLSEWRHSRPCQGKTLPAFSSWCFKRFFFLSFLLFSLLPKNNSYFEEHKYHGRGEVLSFGSWQIFGENSDDKCLLLRAAGKVKRKLFKPFPFVAIHISMQSLSK